MNDLFTNVPGIEIGHAHDVHVRTGVTVIVPDAPMVMAVDVRGGGPCTRETDALAPHTLVERVHALVLAGGSVFGLAAADAVVGQLSRIGIGLNAGPLKVPVVPAAGLFDIGNGGDKDWAISPYPALGLAALAALGNDGNGSIGAGHGATAGSRPGGIGSVSVQWGGFTIGAVMAINSFGEVYAGAPPDGEVPMPKLNRARGLAGQQNTCIGAVATDAPLSRAQAQRVAMMAQDGLARTIRPIHTPFDGDAIFVISTASAETPVIDAVTLAVIGTLAADIVARAVRRAVFGG